MLYLWFLKGISKERKLFRPLQFNQSLSVGALLYLTILYVRKKNRLHSAVTISVVETAISNRSHRKNFVSIQCGSCIYFYQFTINDSWMEPVQFFYQLGQNRHVLKSLNGEKKKTRGKVKKNGNNKTLN